MPATWLSAEEIGAKQFLVARKGFDQDEVRTFLHRVSLRVADLEQLNAEQSRLLAESTQSQDSLTRLERELEARAAQIEMLSNRLELAATVHRELTAHIRALEEATRTSTEPTNGSEGQPRQGVRPA